MATFTEQYAKDMGISLEEARKDIQAWLGYKSNKERWCEEHEDDEDVD